MSASMMVACKVAIMQTMALQASMQWPLVWMRKPMATAAWPWVMVRVRTAPIQVV